LDSFYLAFLEDETSQKNKVPLFAVQQIRIIYRGDVTADSFPVAMKLIDRDSGAAGPRTDPITAQKSIAAQKVINLALQGGGTHGAFTWGVLDRLLDDERVAFEGITASSAGAVNAVVLVDGFAAGGRKGAKKALRNFWRKLSQDASKSLFQPSLIDRMSKQQGLDHSPGYVFMEALAYFASPYQLNPFNYNPLKKLIEECVDFERIRQQDAIKLFLSATNVRTAKVKVFSGKELRPEHVLASTCLPLLMHAVEVDGEFYWDGGYAGNPAIFPLVYECETPDVLLVHLTPADRPDVPTSSPAIMNRMQEISFNTALIREMRSVAVRNRRIDEGIMPGGKRTFVHVVEAEDIIRDFTASSRLNADWKFLTKLFQNGRARADHWLASNFDRVGIESTVDLAEKYF
jgi:NTE family protein